MVKSRTTRANGSTPPPEERRRVGREEGLMLVFAAAQDVARQEGRLGDGVYASLQQSSISPGSFTLKTNEGKTIARVPLPRAREVIRLRRQMARRLTRSTKLALSSHANDRTNRQQFRSQPESVRALAWAISTGRRIPRQPFSAIDLLIALALLLPGLVPGLIALWRLQRKRSRYQQELKQLIVRWRGAGRQDPAPNLFAHMELEG